jgi:uncharacterized protein (TIGR02300 family)
MAKPDLGNKRQCQSCSAKFFDLNKDPIICPKCGSIFQVVLPRAGTRTAAAAQDDEIEIDPVAAAMVPLEDADAADAAAVVIPDDDIEIEDDGNEDDTFLEEEEEGDDDVAGLIDGDIETDEES